MFNWTDNVSFPKLTDVLDIADQPMNYWRMFTYPWVFYFGGWFFAAIIGALAAALYIKYDNAMVPVSFAIIMMIFYGSVLRAEPAGDLISAEIFVLLVGILCAFAVGFLLYQLFVSTEE